MDWQHLFYNHLTKIPELSNFMKIKYEELETYLTKKIEWQDRISKRGLGFISIISKFEYFIKKKLSIAENKILWNDIPGMKIIIECLNYEFSTKEIAQYSDNLINLMKIFINEPIILNRFYQTIIKKTK